jgi:hypothetical protein
METRQFLTTAPPATTATAWEMTIDRLLEARGHPLAAHNTLPYITPVYTDILALVPLW